MREGTNFKSGSLFFPIALDNVGHCIKYTAFKHNSLKTDNGIVDTFLQMPMEFPDDTLSLNWATETNVLAQAGITNYHDMKSAGVQLGRAAKAIASRKAMQKVGGTFSEVAGRAISAEGEDVKKALQRQSGMAVNTFQEQFFDGPSFRSFEFSHEMVAHNQRETETINDIVKRFRYYASPGMDSNAVAHMHWTYPSYWGIWFLVKPVATEKGESYYENDFLPKFGMCVLREVTTNYSGETYGTFSNDAPLHVKITLAFEETTLVDKETIESREGVKRR